MLDVDGLKGVSDSLRHPTGRAAGRRGRGLQALAATDWSLGRVSGDEFVIAPADGLPRWTAPSPSARAWTRLAGCSDTRIAHAGASVEDRTGARSTRSWSPRSRLPTSGCIAQAARAPWAPAVPLPEAGGEPGGEAGGLVHPTGSA